MSRPKKKLTNHKKKIKNLTSRLRSALKKIHELKLRNRFLKSIKYPSRPFKYRRRPRIVKILELKTFHTFPSHPIKLRVKSLRHSRIFNPFHSKTFHHFSKAPFQTQIRVKSRLRPQITKPPELKEFHFFPYLPYEIRGPIWELAVRNTPGRDVILRVDPLQYVHDGRDWAQISSSTQIPALLHTCQLSRILATQRWQLGMRAHVDDPAQVYVDGATDSVCFPSLGLMWHWRSNGDWREVQRFSDWGRVYVMTGGNVVESLRNIRDWYDYLNGRP